MKKFTLTLATLLMMAVTFPVTVFSQCGGELFNACHAKIDSENLVRSYPVQFPQRQNGQTLPVVKHNMMLQSGNTYRIYTCSAEEYPGKVIASLHHADKLIGSTYVIDKNKHLPYIEFECKATGVYNLTLYFENGEKGCAIGILAAKKQEQKHLTLVNTEE